MKGSLQVACLKFICSVCMRGTTQLTAGSTGLDVGNGTVLEKVGRFCYLGDMLNADGGADSAVVTRIRCAWKKFRELSPMLTHSGASLKMKGKIYASCVHSCMTYGNETWPMKADHMTRLERTEMRMIR